jgi:transposase
MRLTSKSKPCVWRWQERYIETGVDGLLRDKTRPSRKKPLSAEVKLRVLTTTMQPPPNATHWSTRSMAKAVGISHSSVQRIWREADLKPHVVRTFKVSNDPKFAEKVTNVVGLYMNPPDKALVLCVNEKSQIQALDRTQPGLPLKKGRAATMTHDYKRNGTTPRIKSEKRFGTDVCADGSTTTRSSERPLRPSVTSTTCCCVPVPPRQTAEGKGGSTAICQRLPAQRESYRTTLNENCGSPWQEIHFRS